MNQYYSEELSQKTRRGQRETRLKGLHCAGRLNYGYYTEKKKVFIHEEEGPIVKEIFERYAAGEQGYAIAKSFAERGILNRGKPFTAPHIYVILRATKYTGKYVLRDEVYENIYPRIIEPELFKRCKQKNRCQPLRQSYPRLLISLTKTSVLRILRNKNDGIQRYIEVWDCFQILQMSQHKQRNNLRESKHQKRLT